MAELKKQSFKELPRHSQLSAVLYPAQVDEETRAEMAALAKGEGKKPPFQEQLLPDQQRGAVSPLDGRARP
jgi:hypothetical protein